jgi:hypothetical protein
MKHKLNLHESKVFNYLYPLYAKEFLFSKRYEDFARIVQKDFDLTPDQWAKLLGEWEFKEISTYKIKSNKMKIIRKIYNSDYTLSEKGIIREGKFLAGYFDNLLNRSYDKADKNSRNEPNLIRLSNKSFQFYRMGKLFVFKID